MSDVFVSHVSEDAVTALEIALALEAAGFSTWAYEVHSVPGPSYLIQTSEAVETAKVVLLLISSRSLGSQQVTREVVRGLESDKPFLPLLLDVSHALFQQRQPEWRAAVGAATSIHVEGDLEATLPRIIAGLEALGVPRSASIDPERVSAVREVLASLRTDGSGRDHPFAQPAPGSPEAPGRMPRGLAMLAAGAALVAGCIAWFWTQERVVQPETSFSADPEPKIVDVSNLQQDLVVLSDLKGHLLAVLPYAKRGDADYEMFYGDAEKLAAQRVFAGYAEGEEAFGYSFWDPRIERGYAAELEFEAPAYRLTCGDTITRLVPLDASAAAELVANAVFTTPRWQYESYALGQDAAGAFYLVDRARADRDRLRLFVGRRGAAKRLAVEDVWQNSGGAQLTTARGRLDIALEAGEPAEMTWQAEGQSQALRVFNRSRSGRLIYSELGAYGPQLGTPCDDLSGHAGAG